MFPTLIKLLLNQLWNLSFSSLLLPLNNNTLFVSYNNLVGILLLNLVINVIIFSNIFWLLTFISKYYYSNKYYKLKFNFYECGFKSLTKFQITYNINFILLILFLLLYDGEFLLLIPFTLNITTANAGVFFLICFFLIWLLFTLFLDYIYSALDWQV